MIRRKRELEALLPLLSSTAAPRVMRELQALAQHLDETYRNEDPRPYMADLGASASGLNGMGGLTFRAEAPPGQGRLIRLPFYLYEGDKTQAQFVQGYYSKDDVFQVETLEILTAGTTVALQTISLVLGGAVAPDVVGVDGTLGVAAIATAIAAGNYSQVGAGWTAVAVGATVVFTCLQPGLVSGLFSFSSVAVGQISGFFTRTQAGDVGLPEIQLMAVGVDQVLPNEAPNPIQVNIQLGSLVPVGWGPVVSGPYNVFTGGGPPFSSPQTRRAIAWADLGLQLAADPVVTANWTVEQGPNYYLNPPLNTLFLKTIKFTTLTNQPIYGTYKHTYVAPPPSSNDWLKTYFQQSQAGVLPKKEIRTLTITDYGGAPPHPDTVDIVLNGVAFPAVPVAAGVSNAALAASIAAAPFAGWTVTHAPGSSDVVFTSVAYASLDGAYSFAWSSGTTSTGVFTLTTPGASKEWVAANQPLWVTGKGVEEVDDSNPTVLVTIPNAPGFSSVRGFRFRTPVLEWAKLRVVGFQVSTRPVPRGEYAFPPIYNEVWPQVPMRGNDIGIDYSNPPPNTMSSNALGPMSAKGYSAYWRGSAPILLAKNLAVGGSANLFIQEGYIDTIPFADSVPEFPGLRAYPVLDPPNRAYIDAAVSGQPLTGMTFSMYLLCDILDDADFGAPISGPYGRRDALMRFDPPDGQGYVR